MKFSPRARWAVPAAVLAAVGAVMAGALIGTAQASPALPARTPAQLLAAVAGRSGPLPALTGTVVESAALGLPDLPGTDNPSSVTSLLTGSHTVRVWYADPRHFRLAMPGMMSESDLIVNGRTAWYWQSTTNSVTRYVLPARDHPADHGPAPAMALTPQQAARQALAAVGPSTTGHRAEQRHGGRRGGLPAGARAAERQLAHRPGADRHRCRPQRAAAGADLRPGRAEPRVRCRLTPRSRSCGPPRRTSASARRPVSR